MVVAAAAVDPSRPKSPRVLTEEFPDEVLIRILGQVRARDLPAVFGVCRRFYRLRREALRGVLEKGQLAAALEAAARAGEARHVESLLERGPPPGERELAAALEAAARGGEARRVQGLLDHGAPLEGGQRGRVCPCTPLYLAVAGGRPALTKILLDAGADPDGLHRPGETPPPAAERPGSSMIDGRYPPLTRAVLNLTSTDAGKMEATPDIIALLLEAGADPRGCLREDDDDVWPETLCYAAAYMGFPGARRSYETIRAFIDEPPRPAGA